MYYWEIVGYVKRLPGEGALGGKATVSAMACLGDITPNELGFALELGGTQPLHDCMVKLVDSTVYIWHKDEAQPPIPLPEEALKRTDDAQFYEVVGERNGLVLVLDHSREPAELVGIAPISKELTPILWMLNGTEAVFPQRMLFELWNAASAKEGKPAMAPEAPTQTPLFNPSPRLLDDFPHLEFLLDAGPKLNMLTLMTFKDDPLAEVVREWLAKRDGISLEQARDKYPYMNEVGRCPWREGLLEDPLGLEAREKEANEYLNSMLELLDKGTEDEAASPERPPGS